MPAKFDRCVKAVRGKSRGRVNAYAVCTAAGTRNPKQERYLLHTTALRDSPPNEQGVLGGKVVSVGHGLPVEIVQKKGHRLLVSANLSGQNLWGWLNEGEVATKRAYKGIHGADPETMYKKSNPESDSASMYESFHGSPSEEVIEFHDQEHYHGNLAGLGVLVELKLCTITGYDVTLSFSDPEALVAANPETSDPIYTDLGYGSLYQKRKGKTWWVRPSFRDSRFSPGKGPDGNQFGDWQKVGESLGPDRAVKSGKLVLYAGNPSVWERLRGIGSRSTVYSVPKHVEKMVKAGSAKGHEIFKAAKGDFRVPTLERESSFDSLADAKKFIGQWSKNPGRNYPDEQRVMDSIREGEMILKSKRAGSGRKMSPSELGAVQRAVDNSKTRLVELIRENDARFGKKNPGPFQSTSHLLGSTGKYLDNQLGRVLNPGSSVYSVSSVNKKPTYHRTKAGAMKEAAKRKAAGDSEVSVGVKMSSGGQYVTVQNPGTSQDPALLCSNEAGTQLYIQGGDQSVDLKAIHMADVPVKDSMILGEAYFVSYFTTKDFDQHKPTIYEHELAEESDKRRKHLGQGSGMYPTVRYDTLNQKLYLDGGEYHITKPMFQTSPGIEN